MVDNWVMSSVFTRKLKRIYDLVAKSPGSAVDLAFVSALPELEEPLQVEALDRLIVRARREGLQPLVTQYASFDAPLRRLILGHVDHLFESIRRAASSELERDRLGCVQIIADSRNHKLAYLLSGMLSRRCANTMTASARALLEMADNALTAHERVIERGDSVCQTRRQVADVAEAIEHALESWHAHFRVEVLTGALWLCEFTEGTLFRQSSSARTKLARAIGGTIQGSFSPRMAGFAIRALGQPELRPVAARAIGINSSGEFISSLMGSMWVALERSIGKACLWVKDAGWCEQNFDLISAFDDRCAAHAVRFLAGSGIPRDTKLGIYKRMLRLQRGYLSEAALWQVVEMEGEESTRVLQEVSRWTDLTLSKIAEVELLRRSASVPDLAPLETDADEGDKQVADSFNELWQRFDMLDHSERQRELEELSKSSVKVQSWVRERLGADESEDRLRALGLVKSLGVVEPFEERIYSLSHDSSTCVRSAAIALLADVRNNIAARILRQALNDPDRRVRANAVESVEGASSGEWIDELKARLEDVDNRVRANAIKALLPLQVREAAVALLEMLDSADALNRMSALWVVDQLNLTTMASRIRFMALDDPDDRIRDRARQILANHARPQSSV